MISEACAAPPHYSAFLCVAGMATQTSMGRFMLPAALLAATLVSVASKQTDSPEVGVPGLYKGLLVWAFVWAFLDAFTIGANDVANAFANAVGCGTVTHRSACMIACVFEFIGCIALGSNVTDTIRSKMVDVGLFSHDPYVLATGMSMVNVGSGGWVLAATLLSMPVSTTHSVVGAVLGIGITAFGWNGVVWDFNKKGFLSVVASWFISPVMAGTLASIFYMTVKILVLKYPDEIALQRGIKLMPLYVFFTFGTIWGFMFMKGIPAFKNSPFSLTVPLTVGLGIFHAILGFVLVSPWLRRTIVDKENLRWWTIFYTPCVGVGSMGYYTTFVAGDEKAPKPELAAQQTTQQQPTQQQLPGQPQMMGYPGQPMGMPGQQLMMGGYPGQPIGMKGGYPGMQQQMSPYGMPVMGSAFGLEDLGKTLVPGFYLDIGAKREEDAGLHTAAFQADSMVEELFKFLQLSSCCFFCIAHGANDVANAVGPFAAVWGIYETGMVQKKASVPFWILVYGAVALDIGLLTMGHHIMEALGNRLTLTSPSRGFCVEIGAMFTVMVASKLGIPVSTTHCISGATVAVGMCNGNMEAVNWKLFAVMFGGWIITCPAAAFVTGMLFWGVVASPKPMPSNGFFTGSVPNND